jgi:light-regulated signal transduction histidine kinase (bacteriophytochrome)
MSSSKSEQTVIAAADAPRDLIDHDDRIAYQYTAIVQAHAAVLVFDPDAARIVQTSANLAVVLGPHPDDALGRRPEEFFEPASADAVRSALRTAHPTHPAVLPDLRAIDARPLVGRVHRAGATPVLEIEPRPTADPDTIDPARLQAGLEQLASDLTGCASMDCCAAAIARNIRAMVGADRCMVYRFDADWNGEVIGEDRGPAAVDSFLGLHFPARDIPRSAREMLASGPVRVTTDQLADPAPLVPRLNPVTGQDLDLSRVRCRATDGACRTYYRNMGVRATLVMPILLDGALWGLISCHHGRRLHAPATCDAPLSVARHLTDAAIEIQTHQERRRAERRAAQVHHGLAGVSPADPAWIQRLTRQIDGFRDLLDADACIVRIAGELHPGADAPDRRDVERLLAALLPPAAHEQNRPVATASLARTHPELAELAPLAAGALAVPLLTSPGDAVLWLRRERPRLVNWAGDPAEGQRWDEQGRPDLTPRASFKAWQQTTAGTARQWTDFDRHVAQTAAINIGMMLLSWQTAQASRSKSEFLANMSHEIRTPMTAILGFTDMLAEDETDPQRADFLATIKRNGAHLLGILNDILDLSKIESGRLDILPVPADPRRVIDECCALLAPHAAARSIDLRTQIDPDVPATIHTDPLRLRQVLLNITGNAVKFTEHGGVTVRVRPEPAPHAGAGALRVEIEDTGIGMTPEQAARVLLPFEQADPSTSRHFGGTGLGLTISARLIALLGGDLAIDSAPGRGTTVRFRLDNLPAPATAVA